MTTKSKLNIAFSFYKKSKKKLLYSIVMFFCCVSTFAILIFLSNIINIIKVESNGLGYRSLDVNIFNEDGSIFIGAVSTELKEEVLKLEHVVDATGSDLNVVGTIKFENNYTSKVSLESRVPKTLPPILYGRGFEKEETDTIICPINFAKSEGYLTVNKNDILNTKKLLNSDVEFEYYDYVYKDKNYFNPPIEDERYVEKFKLIGVFDSTNQATESNTCFINAPDTQRISDIINKKMDAELSAYYKENDITVVNRFTVIVDNKKNINIIKEELKTLGLEANDTLGYLNTELIRNIFIIITIFFSVSLFTTIVISSSYAKKKILREEHNMKVMLVEGFTKKELSTIYALEIFIQNLIIFLIVTILLLTSYFIAINNVGTLIAIKLMIGLKIGYISIPITFLLIVILPSYLIYYRINKKYKNNCIV